MKAAKIEYTIVLVDYYDAGVFFINLAIRDNVRKYTFITLLPSIYRLARSKGFDAHLLHKKLKNPVGSVAISKNIRELRLGLLDYSQACLVAKLAIDTVKYVTKRLTNNDVNLLVWNGSTIFGEVSRYFKRTEGYSTLFFEIANFPGKIFVDSKGVNAASSLYNSEVPGTSNRSDAFQAWVSEYKENKLMKVRSIPQSKLSKIVRFSHLFDFLFVSTIGFDLISNKSKIKKLKSFFGLVPGTSHIVFSDDIHSGFVFFPMQVADDTQLILNSDIDNIQALQHILKSTDKNIIVKPHPAEEDFSYIMNVVSCNKGRVSLSNRNTYELIEASEKVFTINSTVGLEALLFGKSVQFLGRSIFSSMSDLDIENYVMNFLIDLDFFSNEKIPIKIINDIYDRRF